MSEARATAGLLRRLPISKKLVLITMLSTLSGLVLAGAALTLFDYQRIKGAIVRDLSVLTALLAERTNAALLFDDAALARENLASLRLSPQVATACIYAADGSVMASYVAAGAPRASCPPIEPAHATRFEDDHLLVFEPIVSEGARVGTALIRANLAELDRAWQSHLLATLLIIVVVGLCALVLATRLQRIVSVPIAHLAATAGSIAEGRDYSVRAAMESDDETGALVRAFNRMLQTIEAQNHALIGANRELEQRVEERTQDLVKAKERAESADRLKSAFLATMSHELRTPLNSVIGFSGILLQGLAGPLNPEQQKQLGMVSRSAEHLLALINDVLDLSKIEAGQLQIACERFDLRASLERAIETVRPQAEKKGLSLEAQLDPEVGAITSDRRRVEQVVLNLLSNAIKFTEQGRVSMRATRLQGRVVVRVSDTGLGIKPEDLGSLFKAFSQLDTGINKRHEGTGLGLSICKRLAELLGGTIAVTSEFGQGSTFEFNLPIERGVEP